MEGKGFPSTLSILMKFFLNFFLPLRNLDFKFELKFGAGLLFYEIDSSQVKILDYSHNSKDTGAKLH